MAYKNVAREFRGLDPEQMQACGGKPMPVDLNGRKLEGQPFGEWVRAHVREYRAQQLAALEAAAVALQSSLTEAQRMVVLYAEQLERNAARQAEFRARPRV
jgi:hypothetical protein